MVDPWPGSDRLWCDLVRGGLGKAQRVEWGPPRQALQEVHDLLYLPPVIEDFRSKVGELVGELGERPGVRVLDQSFPGEEPAGSNTLQIFDLLETLVLGALSSCTQVPRGGVVLWPVVAGLTDGPGVMENGLGALRQAGVAVAVPVRLELDPKELRRLAEQVPETSNGELFHKSPAPLRKVAREIAKHGLSPFWTRPSSGLPGVRSRNDGVAAVLAQAADLWEGLGRASAEGQELFQAARKAQQAHHDLCAVAREGNLSVFPWLNGLGRQLVEEVAEGGQSATLANLQEEYVNLEE